MCGSGQQGGAGGWGKRAIMGGLSERPPLSGQHTHTPLSTPHRVLQDVGVRCRTGGTACVRLDTMQTDLTLHPH